MLFLKEIIMFYFAYGSNLLSSRLIGRVGDVRVVGVASLHGYTLAFNKRSKDGTAKANIEQGKGVVLGVIYKLTKHQMKKLDPFEGCFKKEKHYVRKLVQVWLNNRLVQAWTYVATHKYVSYGLCVDEVYLNTIRMGIKEHNLQLQI